MSNNYTPTPWPEEGAVVIQQPGDPALRICNYERARACVNACAGISTEALEEAFLVEASVKDNGKTVKYASERRLEADHGDEEGNPDLPPTA